MKEYNPREIEKKWQDYWEENKTYQCEMDSEKEKFYALVEFPYPSAQGLHVGHPRPYTALDIVCRKKRYEGKNVLFPMGWDAFGLPTENFAIKNNIHPRIVTEQNIANFKKQLKSIGFSFDWSREINTTDPNYYKWTQWIFLKMYEHGLAYKKEMPINWCPSCKIGLANEEVVGGKCERCKGDVVHKVKSQWMLKITEYADRLQKDLDGLDYIEKVKIQQKNWIGKSSGASIYFPIDSIDETLEVYTTRPDTIYGSTYMVMAPEHKLLDKYSHMIKNFQEVENYREICLKKSDFERSELNKEKTGVMLDGLYAINPLSKEKMPIFISDYVLIGYGSGAIMAVPAHDQRDYEFAKKFNQRIIPTIDADISQCAYTEMQGKVINSEIINGMDIKTAKEKMIEYLEENKLGKRKTNFKLRDWVFSRQRYWGEPIPLVHCDKCGWQAVKEEDLPVLLPEVENYEPTDDGASPLSKIDDWVDTTCPKCGSHARRETDTMPQWAGSSWYFLRYIDPSNDNKFADRDKLDYWMNVDWYNGGMEHTTLHLLYSRFWYKFLYDIGEVPSSEPYDKRTSHGMILGSNNEKMSKSRGNVVNPDEIVNNYGADTLRTYEMFIGDFEKNAPWSENGVKGCRRFLDRVWKLQEILNDDENYSKEHEKSIHKAIKKVSSDYENLKANTAIAELMSLLNEFNDKRKISREDLRTFLILLNPVAPHITEEIWQENNLGGYLNQCKWPIYDEELTKDDIIELPVQFNGKVRYTIEISPNADKESAMELAKQNELFSHYTSGKCVVKEIYVPARILNIVIK